MAAHTDGLSPSPDLIGMIKRLQYKEGWAFNYIEPFRFQIAIKCTDSTGRHTSSRRVPDMSFSMDWRDATDTITFRDVDRPFIVQHTFVIPPEAVMFSEADMRRWLLDRIVAVETHEACEFFALESKTYPGSYFKPFFPHTGDFDTEHPYSIVDRTPN